MAQTNIAQLISQWPDLPRQSAETVMKKYGPPQEASDSQLIWHHNGPWKRTTLYRDGVPHHFPEEHTDLLEQAIDYRVPPKTFGELARFDGSLLMGRTNGELAVACGGEEMNFVAINLAHEIVTGQRSVEEARQEYLKAYIARQEGKPLEISQDLRFEIPRGGTGDPDEPVITDTVRERVKQELGS